MTAVRIAWFGPLPPVKTGVAACSAELVPALRGRGHLIDAYPEPAAHDFPWRHRRQPYDLIVYQFGNSSHHDYEWAYALHYPGLVVLHDTHLHHARAALLLRERRHDDYRAELRANHPGLNPDVAELAIAGFDSRLYYEWGMARALVESSRLVAVHGEGARRELIESLSDDRRLIADRRYAERIVAVTLGHGQLVTAAQQSDSRDRVRARYGIARDAILFGVFGGLTPEKRLPQILAAFRATLPYAPGAHLLLGGALPRHANISAADYADMAGRVTLTGYLQDDELTDHIASVDVSLNLRWPTARETSGPWLRALAAGTATVITDLVHLDGVPSLDPRTWAVRPAAVTGDRSSAAAAAAAPAVTIAIDIIDEDHSLRLAMRRLATDAALRAALGRAARDYWQREYTVERMADDYERVMARAAGASAPAAKPRRPDDHRLRELLRPFGIEPPFDAAGGAS